MAPIRFSSVIPPWKCHRQSNRPSWWLHVLLCKKTLTLASLGS
jgi:hypothetical protein